MSSRELMMRESVRRVRKARGVRIAGIDLADGAPVPIPEPWSLLVFTAGFLFAGRTWRARTRH